MAENGQVVDVHTEDLAVALSATDQIARGRELAHAQQELESFREKRKKATMATLKAEETGIMARVAKLAAVIATGEEIKAVTVEGFIDYEGGKVVYRRRDTGVVIRERGILPTERQPGLPLGAGGQVLPFDADGKGVPRFEPIEGGAGEQEAGERQAVRAELCGHATEMPQDGSIPKLCKTCCPDGDEVAPEATPDDELGRKPLEVEDYAEGQAEPEGEPDEDQVAGEEPDADEQE